MNTLRERVAAALWKAATDRRITVEDYGLAVGPWEEALPEERENFLALADAAIATICAVPVDEEQAPYDAIIQPL